MKRQKKLKINIYDLHKIMNNLSHLEDGGNVDIDAIKKIKKMMIDSTLFTTAKETIEIEVKVAILEVYGEKKPDASKLENTKKMSAFKFSDVQYVSLKDDFNSIAKKRNPNVKIATEHVRDCKTVNDCIKLVVTKSEILR